MNYARANELVRAARPVFALLRGGCSAPAWADALPFCLAELARAAAGAAPLPAYVQDNMLNLLSGMLKVTPCEPARLLHEEYVIFRVFGKDAMHPDSATKPMRALFASWSRLAVPSRFMQTACLATGVGCLRRLWMRARWRRCSPLPRWTPRATSWRRRGARARPGRPETLDPASGPAPSAAAWCSAA